MTEAEIEPYSESHAYPTAPVHHSWVYRRGVLPILALLRMGATPRTLAWSIAVGLLIGINPLLGTTTLLCLAVTSCFRLTWSPRRSPTTPCSRSKWGW